MRNAFYQFSKDTGPHTVHHKGAEGSGVATSNEEKLGLVSGYLKNCSTENDVPNPLFSKLINNNLTLHGLHVSHGQAKALSQYLVSAANPQASSNPA